MTKLRIGLDIDNCILDWVSAHEKKFKVKLGIASETLITQQVFKCRKDKEFWSNLELLERPDFEPELYCTKRINSKVYTKNNLKKHNLPIKPIYQLVCQTKNKADLIKGKCDVLIDDSYYNVMQCINSGFPALLITRNYNKHIDTPYRVNNLHYKEIEEKYYELF